MGILNKNNQIHLSMVAHTLNRSTQEAANVDFYNNNTN